MEGIRVKKLFGRFNYNIEFSPEGMTIITGPNGYGKSTIVQCILAVSNSDLMYFFDLDFEEIEFLMQNEEDNLLIKKNIDKLMVAGIVVDKLTVAQQSKRVVLIKRERNSEDSALMMENYRKIMERMQNTVGKVEYIQEQRLVEEVTRKRSMRYADENVQTENRVVQSVESIPEKLRRQIRRATMHYSSIANELDSTYPERLFNESEGITQDEFDEKIQIMQEKVEKLSKYGITNIRKLQNIKFKKDDARALKVYFDDFDTKYREYDQLISRLELFTDMVNRRFRFKHVEVSDEKGIEIIDDSGRRIKLLKLSSGEKETLVLFYKLLFDVPDNIWLLIDEPEISLHVAWQRMFAQDLEKIVKSKNLRVIVATHSAQIVNGNRDIQRDLGELYKNGFDQRK